MWFVGIIVINKVYRIPVSPCCQAGVFLSPRCKTCPRVDAGIGGAFSLFALKAQTTPQKPTICPCGSTANASKSRGQSILTPQLTGEFDKKAWDTNLGSPFSSKVNNKNSGKIFLLRALLRQAPGERKILTFPVDFCRMVESRR